MAFEDLLNTSLTLSLFSHLDPPKKQFPQLAHLTNLNLALSSDGVTSKSSLSFEASHVHAVFKPDTILNRQASSVSVISSMSHSEVTGSEKGEIKIKSVHDSKATSDDHRDIEEEGGARKKLRLSKQQSLVLEDNFREHITLNPKQKQALAKQLNLRARQVEVWFQNRRARTKLKQTEVECELLKLCEALKEENQKLQREVQELKALKRAAPPYNYKMQPPAATLSICPSCDRSGGEPAALRHHHQTSLKPHFSINNTNKQFYGHSSAAC